MQTIALILIFSLLLATFELERWKHPRRAAKR